MDASAWLEQRGALVERVLDGRLPPASEPPTVLHAAMRHLVFPGGKRLRPGFALAGCEAAGGPAERALPAAAAVELVHTYSLVHDDLPCMDDDDLRRGRPTVHVAYDEATAVLVGDALLTLAFEVLADAPAATAARLCGILARAAGCTGMVGGQVLDLSLPQDAALAALDDMHARKTAALFAAAAEMGAAAAGAPAPAAEAARAYGRALGLCFQATD